MFIFTLMVCLLSLIILNRQDHTWIHMPFHSIACTRCFSPSLVRSRARSFYLFRCHLGMSVSLSLPHFFGRTQHSVCVHVSVSVVHTMSRFILLSHSFLLLFALRILTLFGLLSTHTDTTQRHRAVFVQESLFDFERHNNNNTWSEAKHDDDGAEWTNKNRTNEQRMWIRFYAVEHCEKGVCMYVCI